MNSLEQVINDHKMQIKLSPYDSMVAIDLAVLDALKSFNCSNCKYWIQDFRIDPNGMFGECDRYGIEGKYHFCSYYEKGE